MLFFIHLYQILGISLHYLIAFGSYMKKKIHILFSLLLIAFSSFAQPSAKLNSKRPPSVKASEKGAYQKYETEDLANIRKKTTYNKPVLDNPSLIKINPEDTIDYDRRAVKYFSQGNNYYVDANAGVGLLSSKHPKPAPKVEEVPKEQPVAAITYTPKPVNTKPIKVRGYRVQLFNGQDREQANKIRQQFVSRFPDVPRYLMFVEPTFRVRVGDFFSRNEAENFLREVQGIAAFGDAIIIRDVIEYKPVDSNTQEEEK